MNKVRGLVVIGLLLVSFIANGQHVGERKVYSPYEVDSMAAFRQNVLVFISKNFNYPKEQETFQGRFVFEFVVNEEGALENITVNGKIDKGLTLAEKEGLRVLRSMPKWEPAMKDGKPVAVRYALPLSF